MVYDPFRPGPHAVQARTLELIDGVRLAPCELWFPEGRDALPLVAFSHLSGGTRLSSAFLCRHLAGHGYAVAALDHTDVVARRVPEVRLVLTELLTGTGGLRLDDSRVGVVGQRFGGWTVLATPDQEPRVRAVVALAPAAAEDVLVAQGLTLILFSTSVTPGADHATRSAASRSAQERTVPLRVTVPPSTLTLI
jgi:Platelet-activating factor acetylhydrolase, isoform II